MKDKKIVKAAKGMVLKFDFDTHKAAKHFYKRMTEDLDWKNSLDSGEKIEITIGPRSKSVLIKGNKTSAKSLIKMILEDCM